MFIIIFLISCLHLKIPVVPRSHYLIASRRYLAAKSESDHYMRELKREEDEINTVPDSG